MLFVNFIEIITVEAEPSFGLHIILHAANNLQQLRTHYLSMVGPAAINWVEDNVSLKYLEREREKRNSIPLVRNRDSSGKNLKTVISALLIMCHSVTRLEVKIWSLLKLSIKMYYLKALLIKFQVTIDLGNAAKQRTHRRKKQGISRRGAGSSR